jgi:hypothetical protein
MRPIIAPACGMKPPLPSLAKRLTDRRVAAGEAELCSTSGLQPSEGRYEGRLAPVKLNQSGRSTCICFCKPCEDQTKLIDFDVVASRERCFFSMA